MRVIILFRPNSEHARRTEEYIAEFERFHPGKELEVVDIDSLEGANLARIYGIIDHPAVLAVKDDGQMQQIWQGVDHMPLMNDLAYFAQQ